MLRRKKISSHLWRIYCTVLNKMVECSLQVFNSLPSVSALFWIPNSVLQAMIMCLTYTETQVPKKALSNFQRSLKVLTYLPTFLSTFFSLNYYILMLFKKSSLRSTIRAWKFYFSIKKIKSQLMFSDVALFLKNIYLMFPLRICITPRKQNTTDWKTTNEQHRIWKSKQLLPGS